MVQRQSPDINHQVEHHRDDHRLVVVIIIVVIIIIIIFFMIVVIGITISSYLILWPQRPSDSNPP